MVFTEITAEIERLSRSEKLQLIEIISKMLLAEENVAEYVIRESSYPVFTPLNQEKAAAQLQTFTNQK